MSELLLCLPAYLTGAALIIVFCAPHAAKQERWAVWLLALTWPVTLPYLMWRAHG